MGRHARFMAECSGRPPLEVRGWDREDAAEQYICRVFEVGYRVDGRCIVDVEVEPIDWSGPPETYSVCVLCGRSARYQECRWSDCGWKD